MASEMDTFAARLASFDAVLRPEKRRSSTTKGSNVIAWPHQSPSPAELAHAGFYYKPYETNPDNTTCFWCNRALDGWEVEDNPITEHLKHSPDCAWAIIMDIQQSSSNPSMIDDPTSERITQARRGTFGTMWPHDGKRGWHCQSEKMVEAGWYFCPNEESDDLASCAYCKLSLDGWEPKDDPFDEHYRRSPDCSFFVFAQLPGKKGKGSKTKKTRTSKASSRLSTQSVATVSTEAPEQEMGEAMDESMISQATVKPKSSKKGPKGKGKKSKKDEADLHSEMDVDTNEPAQPEPPKPRRVGRPRKRTSEEIARDDKSVAGAEPESSEPAPKRRATRTRSSSVSQTYKDESQDHEMPGAAPVEEIKEVESKKSRKGSKKGTSKGRKASDVSLTSKPTSQARLPRDSEIEAEIEAGLEADYGEPEQLEPEPEPEVQPEMDLDDEPEPGPEKPRASKKIKSGKKSKAVMKSSEPPEGDVVDYMDTTEEQQEALAPVEPHVVVDITDDEEAPARKTKSSKTSKKKGTKKAKKQEIVQDEERELEDKVEKDEQDEPEHHHSFLSTEVVSAGPEPEPQPEVEQAAEKPKKSSKKEDKPKKSKKTKKVETSPPPPAPQPVEDELGFQSSPRDEEEFEISDDLPDQIQVVTSPRAPSPEPEQTYERTPVPPKTTKRFSDIPQEEHLAQSLVDSHRSRDSQRTPNQAISPLPVAHQSTPSLSPQSSDAENRPPSSLPSSKRPIAVASPPKENTVRTPLAASTPSPSKRNLNAGFPASAHPWTPVDIDAVLFGDASDKENADLVGLLAGAKAGLTSPEKRMTVEEWIMWNAKNGEERLKRECERLVSRFEKEGDRAMRRLEAIECID